MFRKIGAILFVIAAPLASAAEKTISVQSFCINSQSPVIADFPGGPFCEVIITGHDDGYVVHISGTTVNGEPLSATSTVLASSQSETVAVFHVDALTMTADVTPIATAKDRTTHEKSRN